MEKWFIRHNKKLEEISEEGANFLGLSGRQVFCKKDNKFYLGTKGTRALPRPKGDAFKINYIEGLALDYKLMVYENEVDLNY